MAFASTDGPLGDPFPDVRAGKVQGPDFQRDCKWDDARIASLLATITRGYSIGVVITFETGGDGSRFKPKPPPWVPEPLGPSARVIGGNAPVCPDRVRVAYPLESPA
ncbi:hypothetical protein [Micromonospora cremea]|uniref:Uncharacterized protein n=1 Tax=Micromonospora cremea TaxID=709881 RepID=A0A1N6AN70_9ACTN|nr:hypothetical protein [Micromonospora cremea]SIN35483.1 hypothetical protein SAMN04489832_5813 [Micromonospora cremea]